MLRDSVIVFTTDNGGPAAGYDMNAASNYPLKGVSALLLYRVTSLRSSWHHSLCHANKGATLTPILTLFSQQKVLLCLLDISFGLNCENGKPSSKSSLDMQLIQLC